MRVLYFSRAYSPHDFRFLDALADTEHEMYYLRLEGNQQIGEKRPLPNGTHLVMWEGGETPDQNADLPRLMGQLEGILQEIKPDLVHAGPIQRVAYLIALTGYRPLLSMSWGYDLLVKAKKDFLWEWVTRFTLSKSDAFVGDCQAVQKAAVKYGMDAEKVMVFPWGVDLHHFSPQSGKTGAHLREELGWENEFIILHTRAWAPLYGSGEFLLGFARAAQKNSELRLIMAGDGPQATQIHQMIEQFHLEDRVALPGVISREKLPAYYRAADLYVSASHSDGTSISLLEAMACGTPALVSDIPGNKEWIEEERQGWLFPVGNTEEITEALLKIAGKEEHLSDMGKEARKLIMERGDWEKNFPKLLKAYSMAVQHA